MIKILHTSDLNFGVELPYDEVTTAALHQAQQQTLVRLVDLAIEQQVQLFVVAGNLFSSHAPSPEICQPVLQQLLRLHEEQIEIALLPGCLDHALGPDSVYMQEHYTAWELKDRFVEGEPVRYEFNGQALYLYALPWQIDRGDNAGELMQRRDADGLHIGVLHSHKLENRQVNPYQENLVCWRPAIESWLLDYVIVGNRFSDRLKAGERDIALCPGAPQGLSFSECGPRYCTLVTVGEDQLETQCLEVQTITFQQQELNLGDLEGSDALNEAMAHWADPRLALQLTLVGTVEHLFDCSALQRQLAKFFCYLELKDGTSFLQSCFVQQLAEEDTVRGILCRRLIELAAADEHQRTIYELALRELLQRFNLIAEAQS